MLIHPFISWFFFLSNYQTWKLVTLFCGAVKPTKLTLGTLVNNWWMYCVYQNQNAAAYYLFFPFIFLFPYFLTSDIFIAFFSGTVRPTKLRNLLHIWTMDVCIMSTGIRLLLLYIPLFLPFFFLSNFQTFKIFVMLFSGIEAMAIRWSIAIHPFILFLSFQLTNIQDLHLQTWFNIISDGYGQGI